MESVAAEDLRAIDEMGINRSRAMNKPFAGHNYCDRHRLGTRERLEIFIPVCEAIQHADQRRIIHRDIKPSNVLVAVQDGKAVPKIIDFGVAKATDRRLTEKTVFAQRGYLIGTPENMSPEQAEMTGRDVDTTTDIYSLGKWFQTRLAPILSTRHHTNLANGIGVNLA